MNLYNYSCSYTWLSLCSHIEFWPFKASIRPDLLGPVVALHSSDSPDRSLLSMRRRSESTQNSFPTSLSMARATGFPRPLKNRTSRSVPSSAARSIFGERSSRLVKYMYLQNRAGNNNSRVLSGSVAAAVFLSQHLQTSFLNHTMTQRLLRQGKPAITAPNKRPGTAELRRASRASPGPESTTRTNYWDSRPALNNSSPPEKSQ